MGESERSGAKEGSRRRARRSGLLAAIASLAAHAASLALLAHLLGDEPVPAEAHHGSYLVLSPEPPSPAPARARERARVATAPAGSEALRDDRPRLARAASALEPAPQPTLEPAAPPSGAALEAVPASGAGAEGAGGVGARSLGPLEGEPEAPGGTSPSPECMDGLDNDGDRLTDDEDPECWPALPPTELVSKRTRSLLLSDMRRDDLPEGDPDELGRARVLSRLRPEGDSLVYRDGSLVARIGPDGSVSFDRRPTSLRLEFDMDGTGGAPHHLQKRHFLDATEEIRAEREGRARDRMMKAALARLGGDLEAVWQDRRLTRRQKKRVLFERLEECDLENEGGREAARRIIEFIRTRFHSAGGAPSI